MDAIEKAATPKNVLVIGGGPGGMEAARNAALKGHKVTLWEKGSKLGGQLIPASLPPYKEPMNDLINYYRDEMKRLKVQVVCDREAKKDDVSKLKPDAVVVACGIINRRLDIPGIDSEKVVAAVDVLLGKSKVGDRVAVIGGGLVGCETAEYLATKGKKVTIVEILPKMAEGMVSIVRVRLLSTLREHNVEMLNKAEVKKITPEGLLVKDKEGQERLIQADNIIVAVGVQPNDNLVKQLQPLVPEVYTVGDCRKPRDLISAVEDGYEIGIKI
jgi:NADPH-dependent 2,4-dienoyl-CoA reductase/sulfur reductase-like enzyme